MFWESLTPNHLFHLFFWTFAGLALVLPCQQLQQGLVVAELCSPLTACAPQAKGLWVREKTTPVGKFAVERNTDVKKGTNRVGDRPWLQGDN